MYIYIDKLDGLVNKYRNTCLRTIKMKPVDVNSSISIDFNKENNMEDPNFKFGEHVKECQNIKAFLQKALFQIGLMKKLLL